jgi:hypothetical protein
MATRLLAKRLQGQFNNHARLEASKANNPARLEAALGPCVGG